MKKIMIGLALVGFLGVGSVSAYMLNNPEVVVVDNGDKDKDKEKKTRKERRAERKAKKEGCEQSSGEKKCCKSGANKVQ